MFKNQEFQLKITDIGDSGEGIGHFEGMAVFVNGTLPGDVILAGATKVKKKYAYARMIELIEPSADRVESPCPISDKCGGCSLMSLSYEKQLEYKAKKVRDKLIRIGGFDESFLDGIAEPILGMSDPMRYRNKAQYPVGEDGNGRFITGFYAVHSHRIVAAEDCYIGDKGDADILSVIKKWMTKNDVSAYDETSGKGVVRHVLIRRGCASKEGCALATYVDESIQQILVCLIVNSNDLPYKESLISDLSQIQGMHSISININTRRDNVILGKVTKTLWGEDTIRDYSLGIGFNISPASFFQVNRRQTVKLYEKALSYAALTGKETVWDLYCGIGTISLFLAQKARRVLGVEIVPEAIDDAKKNAKEGGFDNAFFMTGAAEEIIPAYYEGRISFGDEDEVAGNEAGHPDVVVVDPPRKGCDEKLLATILSVGPDRIVYVSCDPATLARDLRILTDGGYELRKYCPCDMFPFSHHVETVVLLNNKFSKAKDFV